MYIYISRFICQIITRGGEGIGRGASIHRYTRYTWYVYKILSWLGPIVHFYNWLTITIIVTGRYSLRQDCWQGTKALLILVSYLEVVTTRGLQSADLYLRWVLHLGSRKIFLFLVLGPLVLLLGNKCLCLGCFSLFVAKLRQSCSLLFSRVSSSSNVRATI